jgi:photosystem II stability/assembly factor-like uncharacterized protein
MNSFGYFWQKLFMRYLLLLLVSVLFTFCSGNGSKEFTSVEIIPVFQDSVSIRAIAPLDEHRVWFAANRGRVGLIDSLTPKLASIKYQDSLLAFRSIAAVRNSVFVLSVANPAVLYKIGFDGETATNIEEVYVEQGEKVFYDSMAFWNDNEGIAMGDPTEDCMSVIITRDGGNSWTKLPCDVLPKVEAGEAAFAASNSNLALYGDHAWMVSGGKRARVFHSPDKGNSWEVFETPFIQGKAMTGIYSVDFLNEEHGVIYGGNWEDKAFNEGNKAITKDGGKTWTLISNGSGPGYRSSVRFVPGTEGEGIVAVGSPGISYSPDRGESWTELSETGFYAIEFVNDTLAFASGRNIIAKLFFK